MFTGIATIAIEGVDLRVEARGAGRPLVLAHGFAGDRHTWDGVWETLTRDRYGVRYDLRGFGASRSREEAPFSHARDLEGLLDELGVEACDLAGVSLGGAVAINFALSRPARVRRLVLVSPALNGWEFSDSWRAYWSRVVAAAQAGDLAAARELWWKHPLFEATRETDGAAEALRRSIEAYSGRHWIEPDRHEPCDVPDVERLHGLAAPTLLLTGARDLEDFRVIADVLCAAAPEVTRIDYAGAGHLLHLERPEAFVRDVELFLGPPRAG